MFESIGQPTSRCGRRDQRERVAGLKHALTSSGTGNLKGYLEGVLNELV